MGCHHFASRTRSKLRFAVCDETYLDMRLAHPIDREAYQRVHCIRTSTSDKAPHSSRLTTIYNDFEVIFDSLC
eukprot:6444979-Amphidinium_carterae.1